jgi:hypothetical protein
MFDFPGYDRAPIGRSAPDPRRRRIGRRIGRSWAVWGVTCLLLIAPGSLVARASSCPASNQHCGTQIGDAPSDGGTSADNSIADHPHSTTHGEAVVPDTSAASTHARPKAGQGPDAAVAPHKHGNKASHQPTNHAGSGGPGHHQHHHHHRQAGRHHSYGGASPDATKHPSITGSEPNPSPVAIGHVSVSVDRVHSVRSNGAQNEGDDGAPQVVSRPASRVRMPDSFGTPRTVQNVAGALRFPVVLLGVILLFMAFQQRADRRDHMLAHAPVGSRQETLEFR